MGVWGRLRVRFGFFFGECHSLYSRLSSLLVVPALVVGFTTYLDSYLGVRVRVLALLLLLCGCATSGLTDIVQEDVTSSKLYDICEPNKKISSTLFGCKRVAFNRCYVYVLLESEHPSKEEYLDTVAHERKHCAEGRFHP